LIDVEENVKLQIENLLTELSKRSDTIKEIQGTILALKAYVDTKSKILFSMLHLILSCFRLPSSDKDSTNLSCFSTSTSIALLPWKVCKSDAYAFRARTEDYGRID
jgi:hypothetical protein